MRLILLLLATSFLATAQAPGVASLLTKDIPEMQGKEVTMLTITYAPGQSSPAHRHHAHVFVYVLSGSIVMQVAGGEAKQLGPGDTFYEKPSDTHVVGKNASATEPAKFLVMMLKDKDKPVSEPATQK